MLSKIKEAKQRDNRIIIFQTIMFPYKPMLNGPNFLAPHFKFRASNNF